MQEILDAKKIRIDPIPTSMHRMVSTGISFAGIAIEELSAKYMRAYGNFRKKPWVNWSKSPIAYFALNSSIAMPAKTDPSASEWDQF